MTGKRVGPPPSARKVPGLKVWMTEDGRAFGPYWELKAKFQKGNAVCVGCRTEDGRDVGRGVAKLMAQTWMPPKPPDSKLVHLDGDWSNNAAANLAWAPKKTNNERVRGWKSRTRAAMEADPNHPFHGKMSGWRAGCPCDACRNVGMLYRRRLDTRKTIEEVEECARTT